MKESIKECSVCGKKYNAKHGNNTMCPECRKVVTNGNGRNIPNVYRLSPRYNQNLYELHIRQNAIERAKHNDSIVGEGYAERQIADTLSKVEKIKTEL